MSVYMQNYLDISNAQTSGNAVGHVGQFQASHIRNTYPQQTAGMTDLQVSNWYSQNSGRLTNEAAGSFSQNSGVEMFGIETPPNEAFLLPGQSPDEINAQIHQQQRQDWENRFKQFEQQSYDNVTDPARLQELRNQALGISTNAVEGSYNRTANRMETYRSRFGHRENETDMPGTNRANAVQKSANLTMARNQTRGYLQQREMGLLGGAPTAASSEGSN